MKKIEIAKIVAGHGIRGQVKVKSMTENPRNFLTYGEMTYADNTIVPDVKIHTESKGNLIVSIDGVEDRNAAERLKGKSLFVSADALPEADEDEFYASDLEGLQVRLEDGNVFGTVKALLDFGAGEMLEVTNSKNKTEYFPFTLAAFPEVNVKDGWILLVPPSEVVSQDDEGGVH